MGGAKPRRSTLSCIAIHFLHLQFFDLFYNPLFIHQPALLEPTCPILVSNLASKMGSKSMVFGVQEPTYVATTENVKICTTLKRKPCFSLPRPPKNPPKFDKKIDLKSLLCCCLFLTPKTIPPGALPKPSCQTLIDFWPPCWAHF